MRIAPYHIFQCLLCIVLGLYFFFPEQLSRMDDGEIRELYNREVRLSGEIVEFPDIRKDSAKYTVGNLVDESGKRIEGNVLVNTFYYPVFPMSSKIEVSGIIEEPFETEEFSYKDYLRMFNVFGIMKRPYITPVSVKHTLLSYLFTVKMWFENSINRSLPEPHASLAAGLITGSRRGIPEDTMEQFNITGLTHIVAISGYNIALVITLISALFSFLPQTPRTVLSIVAVFIFVLFVGAQASVVRAGIMGSLSIIALRMRRPMPMTNILLLTSFIMCLINPYVLRDDIGFQLSFTATLGLIYLSPILQKLFEKMPEMLGLKEAILLIISAQICVTPLLLLYFERLSLVSIPANVIVAPFIPFAMLFGSFIPVFEPIFPFLHAFLVHITYGTLEIILQTAAYFSRIPGAYITFGVSEKIVSLWYLFFIIIVFILRKTKYFTPFPLFGRVER